MVKVRAEVERDEAESFRVNIHESSQSQVSRKPSLQLLERQRLLPKWWQLEHR